MYQLNVAKQVLFAVAMITAPTDSTSNQFSLLASGIAAVKVDNCARCEAVLTITKEYPSGLDILVNSCHA